jgi:predicted acetyltransferase
MGTEIVYRRAEGDEDRAAFARLLDRSFALPKSFSDVAWSRFGNDVRFLSEGRDTLACLAWYAVGQWFGGRAVPCAGIAAVGVEPHRRGERLATRIVAESLRELARDGAPLAALYPSNLALYRGAGFEVAGGRYELRASCRALAREKSEEQVVPLPDGVQDDRVRARYAAAARTREGWLDRNEAIWDRVRDFRGQTREAFGVERDGHLAGYVFLARVRKRALGYELVCGDLVAADASAGRALLGFLGAHGTIAMDLTVSLAPWDPLVGLVTDLHARHSLQHPWMLRVLDVRAALEARGFSPHARGELHLDVEDALLPHNAGRSIVEVEGGVARVRAGGSGRVRVRARGLGPWFSGHQSAQALAFAGLVDGPRADLDLMTALTAGVAPSMPDFF